jgi:phosphate:Na+ symporter
VVALTGRLTPVDPVEQASQPHYIYDRAVEDPVNALTLARLERDRLTQSLPKLLPDLDAEQADALTVRRHLLAGHRNVAAQTASFLLTVMGRGLTRDDLARAAHEQSSLENVQALQDTLAEFGTIVDAWRGKRPNLLFSLCEGLRTLICLLAETTDDAERKADPNDLDTLIQLCGDRGEMLERLRRQLMLSDMHDGAQTRELLMATRLFERAVWLVRRIAIARREQGAGTGKQIAAADPSRQIEDAHSG